MKKLTTTALALTIALAFTVLGNFSLASALGAARYEVSRPWGTLTVGGPSCGPEAEALLTKLVDNIEVVKTSEHNLYINREKYEIVGGGLDWVVAKKSWPIEGGEISYYIVLQDSNTEGEVYFDYIRIHANPDSVCADGRFATAQRR